MLLSLQICVLVGEWYWLRLVLAFLTWHLLHPPLPLPSFPPPSFLPSPPSPPLLFLCSMPRIGASRMDIYSVIDYGVKSVVHCEHVPCHPNVTFPKTFEDTVNGDHMLALWTVSQAKAKFAFFFTILENCENKRASYLCLAQNE